jgi:ParB family chromosome partitioning protein
VARSAYLKLYPEHADRLPNDCRYVMAAGERRWRAAVRVGLDSLDLMLRHDLTESRVRFLAAVLSENVQRANFNPIEEADGLRAMLELHDGNQAAAARAMGKSKAWFNQRIGLLRLSEEMVRLVFDGKLTAFRDMRRYAALPADEQHAAWKADQEAPPPPKPPVAEQQEQPPAYTAVYPPPASPHQPARDQPAAGAPLEPTAVPMGRLAGERPPLNGTAVADPSDGIPEPREELPDVDTAEGPLKRFPYDNGRSAAGYLISRMPDDEFDVMLEVLLEYKTRRAAARS